MHGLSLRQAYDYWQDQPGFCVPSAVDRGLQQPCQSQKASAQRVRIEQTRHKYRDKSTNVWLTLSKAKQAAKLSKSKLQQPILAWKAGTNAADFTKPKFTQQVQTHRPEPNAKDASNHTPNTLSVTCRRHRLPSLQGCIPVNNS